MDLSISKKVDYAPDVGDNLTLPKDEQVVVNIKLPTPQEQSILYKLSGDGSEFNLAAGVSRFVSNVRNLSVNGEKISNGREMVSTAGLTPFVNNIGTHILELVMNIDTDPT